MSKADAWAYTPEGASKYKRARAEAQKAANADGRDRGLERNDLSKSFNVFALPRRENRQGHELRCEVVSCEDLSRCQPGHGPAVDARRATASSAPAYVGYPPHDLTLRVYLSGAEKAKCWAPLLLPEQAGAVLVEVCVCGKDEAAHKAGKGCEIGYRAATGCLYCPQCKVFLVADDGRIEKAQKAARVDKFKATATLAPPAEKAQRATPDAAKMTMQLFPQHPEYHAKFGRAR